MESHGGPTWRSAILPCHGRSKTALFGLEIDTPISTGFKIRCFSLCSIVLRHCQHQNPFFSVLSAMHPLNSATSRKNALYKYQLTNMDFEIPAWPCWQPWGSAWRGPQPFLLKNETLSWIKAFEVSFIRDEVDFCA